MSIISKIIGGGGGSGLSEAQVDARVVAVAPTVATSRTVSTGLLADDGVFSIDFSAAAGSVIGTVLITENFSGEDVGSFAFRSGTNPFVVAIANSGFTLTTGALTGTTGTDGNLTLSAHTDKKLYLENRIGSNRTYIITVNSNTLY